MARRALLVGINDSPGIRHTAGKVSRTDLLKLVRASLKHEGFSQVPQLECAAERKSASVFS